MTVSSRLGPAVSSSLQHLIEYLGEVERRGFRVEYNISAGFVALSFTGELTPFSIFDVAYELATTHKSVMRSKPILIGPNTLRFDFNPHI